MHSFLNLTIVLLHGHDAKLSVIIEKDEMLDFVV